MKIIPTIFATSEKQFHQRFNRLLPISKNLQIDLMDGKFVSSKSLSLKKLPNLNKFNKNFEAHLMVLSPEKYFPVLTKKGFKKVIFHFESTPHPEKVIRKAEFLNLQVWIAINPNTHFKKIVPFLSNLNGVLFMGVNPGEEHQKLISSVVKKIKDFRKFHKKILIQVDGGVNEKTAIILFKAGANILNSGSFVSESENPKEALKKLKQ